MGQNGLSGGFFRPRIKSDATIFMHRHEKAATKKGNEVLGVQLKLEFVVERMAGYPIFYNTPKL